MAGMRRGQGDGMDGQVGAKKFKFWRGTQATAQTQKMEIGRNHVKIRRTCYIFSLERDTQQSVLNGLKGPATKKETAQQMLTLSDLSCDTDRRVERIFWFNSDPAQPIEVPHPTSYPPKTSERSLETRKTYQNCIMGSEHLPNASKTLMKAIQISKLSKIFQNVNKSSETLQTLEHTLNN